MCRHNFLISNSDYVNLWLSMPLLTQTVATLPLAPALPRSTQPCMTTHLWKVVRLSGTRIWIRDQGMRRLPPPLLQALKPQRKHDHNFFFEKSRRPFNKNKQKTSCLSWIHGPRKNSGEG
jgi:hypothetical protein